MELEARKVTKQYDECILEQVSLTVKQNEIIAISGPSGCGKSTLLFILGMLSKPTAGELLYNGKNMSEASDKEISAIRSRKFGFVFQDTRLLNNYTVLENVLLPAEIAGEKGLAKKAKRLLTEFGLEKRLSYYPYQLSIGQRRRVSIARALILSPEILFADEPTNDLDEKRAQWVEDLLTGLPEKNCSVVVASHDKHFLDKISCRYEIKDMKVNHYVN